MLAGGSVLAASAASAADLHQSYYTATAHSAPIAGPAPIWDAISVTRGAARATNPTSSIRFAGGLEGGYNWQTGQLVFGGEGDIQVFERQRHVRAVEILQSVVRYLAGVAPLRAQQRPDLRHGRHRVRRCGAETIGLASESHHQCGLDRRGGGRRQDPIRRKLVGKIEYLFVDLSSSTLR